jgi:hypothetical protein
VEEIVMVPEYCPAERPVGSTDTKIFAGAVADVEVALSQFPPEVVLMPTEIGIAAPPALAKNPCGAGPTTPVPEKKPKLPVVAVRIGPTFSVKLSSDVLEVAGEAIVMVQVYVPSANPVGLAVRFSVCGATPDEGLTLSQFPPEHAAAAVKFKDTVESELLTLALALTGAVDPLGASSVELDVKLLKMLG